VKQLTTGTAVLIASSCWSSKQNWCTKNKQRQRQGISKSCNTIPWNKRWVALHPQWATRCVSKNSLSPVSL